MSEPKPYTASDEWHGGRIVVFGEPGSYAISQEFSAGKGPARMSGASEYPLGWQKSKAAAIREARTHAAARGACPIFIQLESE